jgi:dTDP-4-amino-4,6-dideoxygalactose transaminase
MAQSLQFLYPIQKPQIPPLDRVLPYLRQMEVSGKFSNFGPLEQQLRRRFSDFFGVDETQIATCANATLAITGATEILPATKWFVPSFTFAATVHAVLHGRKDVHLVDISRDDWEINLEILNPLLTSQSGILPVAPFGSVPKIERYTGFDYVVHDAAASIGSDMDLSKLKPNHAIVFSLHATKVLGSGEGSVVVFGSREYADEFRMWSNFGFKGSRDSRISAINAKMSEIQAAYVHGALDGWQSEHKDWLASRNSVNEISENLGMKTKFSELTTVSPYWIIELESQNQRDLMQASLNSHGFETRLWWSHGCHMMPAFANLPKTSSTTTDLIASIYIGLPINRNLDSKFKDLIKEALSHAITP